MTRAFDAAFYGSALSENITETPEGYLICHDVPLGRIGKQIYLGREIAENLDPNKQYTVYRFPEDVFEPEAIASGEAKPLTEDHPHDPVTPDNHHIYAKGHVQNVRPDDHREYLLGDVVIKDRDLINKVKKKQKREISIGYDTEYIPHGEGFKQTAIRINHIALVAKGRAGPRVKINDSETVINKKRRPIYMNRKKAMATILAAFAKDADPEELKAVLMALDEDTEEEEKKRKEAEDKSIMDKVLDALRGKDKKSKDSDEEDEDEEEEKEREAAKDRKKAKDKKSKDKKSKDNGDDDELEAALDSGDEEETMDSEEEVEKEDKDEEETKDRKKAHDHYIEFVKDLKPTLAALPPQYRKLVKDALRENAPSNGNYKRITESVRANAKAKRTKDGEIVTPRTVDEICANYDRFNPLNQ